MRVVLDIFAQIFRNLWAHKLRSFLTMFGIAWGVGSLLLLVGVGEGFRSGNKRELAEFGKDIMFLFPGRAPGGQGQHGLRSVVSAHLSGLLRCPHAGRRTCAMLLPSFPAATCIEVSEFATAGGEIMGVEPQLNEISFLPLNEGRWLNEMDAAQRRNVIVLGNESVEGPVSRPSGGGRIRSAERRCALKSSAACRI